MEQLTDLPFNVEGPGMEEEAGGGGQIPGYVEAFKRCALCKHFEDADGWCRKFRASCEPDGACPAFEEGADEGDDQERSEYEPELEDEEEYA